MSDHVSLSLLNELRKSNKSGACRAFFVTSFINSIIQEPDVRFYLSYDIKITLKSHLA